MVELAISSPSAESGGMDWLVNDFHGVSAISMDSGCSLWNRIWDVVLDVEHEIYNGPSAKYVQCRARDPACCIDHLRAATSKPSSNCGRAGQSSRYPGRLDFRRSRFTHTIVAVDSCAKIRSSSQEPIEGGCDD